MNVKDKFNFADISKQLTEELKNETIKYLKCDESAKEYICKTHEKGLNLLLPVLQEMIDYSVKKAIEEER